MEILFVEDDEIDQMQIKRIMKKNNDYSFVIVNDGLEALTFLETSNTVEEIIVISDVNMPNMNGISLLEVMKANDKTSVVPFFLFVTNEADAAATKAKLLNVSGFLQKPFSIEKFEDVLKRMGND